MEVCKGVCVWSDKRRFTKAGKDTVRTSTASHTAFAPCHTVTPALTSFSSYRLPFTDAFIIGVRRFSL